MGEEALCGGESPIWDEYEQVFLDTLQACLEREAFIEYCARQEGPKGHVWARTRVYQGEKLDRVMVNRYTLKSEHGGLVIFGYPRTEYALPAFLLHIGGLPPTRTLAIMDLSPCSPGLDMAVFGRVAAAQRRRLGLAEAHVDWLRPVTSPHLLNCPLKPLDPVDFLPAFAETVETWRDAHLEPAQRDDSAEAVRAHTQAVLDFKTVLFRNDPAFRVFTRAFGKTMSDVLAEAAFGGNPGLSVAEAAEPLPAPGSWENRKLGVRWRADAQERLYDAPAFLRPMIRRIIEKEASRAGIEWVDLDLVKQCEKKYRSGMEL